MLSMNKEHLTASKNYLCLGETLAERINQVRDDLHKDGPDTVLKVAGTLRNNRADMIADHIG